MNAGESCQFSANGSYIHSKELARYVILNFILNVILMIAAMFGNGVIIVAILRSQSLRTPSYLLITSLAFTDLLFGLVFRPLHTALYYFFVKDNTRAVCAMINPYRFFFVLFIAMVLFLVTCISIDRYLAITLRHRYAIIVTKKRVLLVIVALWILASTIAFLSVISRFYGILFIIGCCLSLALMSTTCVFYIKSFRALHRYTVQVHAQQPNPLTGNFDVVRFKKTLNTMLIVLACLLVCYVPAICTLVLQIVVGVEEDSVIYFSITVILLGINSSTNPIVYLVRFKDIRNACRQICLIT